MHAADVVATLPAVRLGDPVLWAARLVSERGLPGLAVTDESGDVVACMSSVDLLWLALPRYLRDAPRLAWIFDEEHADRVAEALVGSTVGDVVDELTERVPSVESGATVVEVAETMVQRSCPLVRVERGVVTANDLLGALVSAVDEVRR